MTSAYFITDSVGEVAPYYPTVASARLGWTPTIDSVGGTGFGDGTGSEYRARVPACIAAAPNVVVVQGSGNDVWYTVPALAAEFALFFAALRAGLPSALVYALAPWPYGGAGLGTSKADMGAALRAAVEAVGGAYIDWSTWINASNAAVYLGPDGVHPMATVGVNYIGTRLASVVLYGSTPTFASFATEAGKLIAVSP